MGRWIILGICVAPIGGSFLYNLGFHLSEGPCLFQRIVGIISPSCGLTRSFMAIARGDWAHALVYHAFGPALFGIFSLVAMHTAVELILGRAVNPFYRRVIRSPAIYVIGILLFMAYYGLRLYARYGAGDLPFSLSDTMIWRAILTGAQAL